MIDDKRGEARQRTLKGAQIIFGKPARVIDCTIRNQSKLGAQVAVASVMDIPDQFELLEISTGERRPATVIWRKVGLLGLRFDE